MSDSGVAPTQPGAAEDALAAFQEWQAGNQEPALARIRARADRGEPWAIGFLPWLLMQRGVPGFEEAIQHALKARDRGMPWVAGHLFNNIIGNIPSAPHLLEPALELLSFSLPLGPNIDPVGNAWNLLAQGQGDAAVRLMSIARQFPQSPQEWDALVKQANSEAETLKRLVESSEHQAARVATAAHESIEAIEKHKADLETEAKQAGLLVRSISGESVNFLFDADAERNAGESRSSWRWGIRVLVGAAFVAALPLLLHYVGWGPDYSRGEILGAHAGSTAALGTVAGVLLARARGRDRAHQRARDVSTAMGTMISYSNQIQDEREKQQFMLTMGQLVLQAHLQGDSSAKEESLVGLATLLNALRQPSQPSG